MPLGAHASHGVTAILYSALYGGAWTQGQEIDMGTTITAFTANLVCWVHSLRWTTRTKVRDHCAVHVDAWSLIRVCTATGRLPIQHFAGIYCSQGNDGGVTPFAEMLPALASVGQVYMYQGLILTIAITPSCTSVSIASRPCALLRT